MILAAMVFALGANMAGAASLIGMATELTMLDEEEVIIVNEPVEFGDVIVTEDGDVYEVQQGVVNMQKKSPIIGAILGFILIGLPYSGGWKKGLLAFLALTVLNVGLNVLLEMPICSLIGDAIGAYLGYTWVNEHNAALGSQEVIAQ